MRTRTNRLWALVGGFALIVLLVSAWHPAFAAMDAAGMSAPSLPRTSVESAPLDKLLQSHFDGCGPARRTAGIVLALSVCSSLDSAKHDSHSAQHYGPMHRRPPPSLS
jgi:hypothetical protein